MIARVLPGFPAQPFETLEDMEAHLGGERVVCLLCGKSYEAVLLHARRTHDMGEIEYRQRFNIPWKYPITGRAFHERRSKDARRAECVEQLRAQRAKKPHTGPLTPLGRKAKERPLSVLVEALHLLAVHGTVGAASRASKIHRNTLDSRIRAAKERLKWESQ